MQKNTNVHSTDGIVLRTIDYGEADRIVAFLTPDQGIFRGFGRNARKSKKRFGAALQSCAQVRLFWTQSRSGALPNLQEVELVDLRTGLRRDLTAIALASYGCDLTEKLLHEGQTHPEIYYLLRALLDRLAEAGGSAEARVLFELRLLQLSGYAPHLRHCSECGGGLPGEEAGFDARRGGSLCAACMTGSAALRVYPPVLGTLARCLETPVDLFAGFRFSPRTVTDATAVLADALRQHWGSTPKSLPFLEEVLAEADPGA